MPKTVTATPITFWVIIFAIPTMLFSGVVFLYNSKETNLVRESISTQLVNYSDEKTLAIFVGNSLVEHGIVQDHSLLGPGTYSIFLTLPSGEHFVLQKHMDYIYELNPEFLVLQAEMFSQLDMTRFKRIKHDIRAASRKLRRGFSITSTAVVCKGEARTKEEYRNDLSYIKGFYKRSNATLEDKKPWLEEILDHKIKPIIIDVPRSMPFEEEMGNEFVVWRKNIIALAKQYNVPIIFPDNTYTLDNFCDKRHMTDDGSRKYTDVLKSELIPIVNDAN